MGAVMTAHNGEFERALQENLKLRQELAANVDKAKDSSKSQKRSRLNGWQRISILLSVIWFVGFVGFVWTDYGSQLRLYAEKLFYLQSDANLSWLDLSLLFGIDLIIIALACFLAWLGVVTVRWVRRGFQPVS